MKAKKNRLTVSARVAEQQSAGAARLPTDFGALKPVMTSGTPRYSRTGFVHCQIFGWFAAVVFSLGLGTPVWGEPTGIEGRWRLDADSSTDAAKELKGIRASKKKSKSGPGPSPAREAGRSTEQRYWQEANAGKEWRHSNELVHAGPLQRLLESDNLEIVARDNGYLFIYADGYERSIVPNPGGRVFTASGDEMVKTDVGTTLAYWDAGTLVLETRLRSGKLIERIETNGDELSLTIEIDRRDWKWIARLDRNFRRSATASSPQ